MLKFNVTGMSCAACSARVERAVSAVPGIESVSVSLLTNSMVTEGTAQAKDIIRAVKKAGYGCSLSGNKYEKASLSDNSAQKLFRRLITSAAFLLLLMYVSMGHMMWDFPLPEYISGARETGFIQLVLSLIIIIINRDFFISGFKGIFKGSLNMNTLVAIGSGTAFVYSTVMLAKLCGTGDETLAKEFCFESAAMILTLITVGKTLEAKAKGRTTDALKSLSDLAPDTATLIINGEERKVSAKEIKLGDEFAVYPGERFPADGKIISGSASVDESMLTGESIPADKASGDTVSAGTVNLSGYVRCKATGIGEDMIISQIIRTVSEASATKAPIARMADKAAGVFIPAVMAIAAVTFAVWMLCGYGIGFSLQRAVSVLVISCPCALGLATPVAIMVANGVGARNGVLFKTAASIEETGRLKTVVFDKTGTVTRGEPEVSDIIEFGCGKDELLSLAATLEAKSEHPLARAIMRKAYEDKIPVQETEDFRVLTGSGIEAVTDGEKAVCGSVKYVLSVVPADEEVKNTAKKLADEGKTPLIFAKGNRIYGIIAVSDQLRAESVDAIAELKKMNVSVVMLTGDNEKTAKAVARKAGIDRVFAGVLPSGKRNVIQSLKKEGKVSMVGDGINDAPALTEANVGMAIGNGTDIAIDSADIVLMSNDVKNVPFAVRLGRKTLRIIKENLFWAFFYNALCIPLAAGVWIPIFGWELEPVYGALAMSLSSITVVLNALRITRK